MDDAEIARLREINDGFGRPDAQRSRLTVGEVRALLDALEQARKREGECAEAALDWEKEARIKSEQLAVVIFQRDAAQQSAKDARALLDLATYCLKDGAKDLRAEIEAFLEPKA